VKLNLILLAPVLILPPWTSSPASQPPELANQISVPDAQAVLVAPKKRIETADYRATGHLVRVAESGQRTSYAITLKVHWFPGILRVLCEITSPAEVRVHVLLETRPNGQDSIQIAHPGDKTPTMLPFSKWTDGPIGPGFSYEDLLEPQFFWPSQKVIEETKYGARDCDLLLSTPGAGDHSHYTEVKTWLDHTIGYPVYVEKSLKGTGTVKEFTYFGLRQNGGVWYASQVEEKMRGQNGSTLLIIDRGSTKANLDLRDFSPEQLIKF
jgi:hypothetical protein